MTTRRGAGEGSIYRRSDGRWAATMDLGWTGGTRRRKTIYGKTRKEVAGKLTVALKEQQDGLPAVSVRKSLGVFLDEWLIVAKTTVRHTTWTRYETLVRLHVKPKLGKVSLVKLGPQHLQTRYAELLAEQLAPATVTQLHRVLHRALSQGVRWGLLARNVAELVSPPRVPRHEITALTPEEARAILAAADGDPLEAPTSWRSRQGCVKVSCSVCAGGTSTSSRAPFTCAPLSSWEKASASF